MSDYYKLNSKTSDATAATVGKEIAQFFLTAKGIQNIDNFINTRDPYVIEMFTIESLVYNQLSDTARAAFLSELAKPFGEIQVTGAGNNPNRNIDTANDLRKIVWRKQDTSTGALVAIPQETVVIVPISVAFLLEPAINHTASFQVFKQQSKTTGTENAIEFYIQTELSISVEIAPKVFSWNIKEGVKASARKFDRTEWLNAERTGRAMSASYKVEKCGRTCMAFYLKPLGKVRSGPSAVIQIGYAVRLTDMNNKLVGPFWHYGDANGKLKDDDSRATALKYLQTEIDASMIEMAKQAAIFGN